ncbi:MAG: CDP-archaeol synthase [Brachymonas sp.]|nr:CDP-archaeol synthase [Brachymonas sp.]
MLKQRVITALVLLVVLLGVLSHPSPRAFPLFMVALIGATGWEWGRLSGLPSAGAWAFGAVMAASCRWMLATHAHFGANIFWAQVASAWSALWLIYACSLLRLGIPAWQRLPRLLRLLLGWLSLCMAWIATVRLHMKGSGYLLSVIALVWMADVAAYFAGRAFGKRKLAPQISPGKSWAGAVGGTVGVLLMALIGARVWPNANNFYTQTVEQAGWPVLALLAAAIAVVSIMGDLVESLMKRSVGIKDSSHLLPGHGGILDRIDSLLPVLPLAFAATMWMQS